MVGDEALIGLMPARKLRSFSYVIREVVTTGEEARAGIRQRTGFQSFRKLQTRPKSKHRLMGRPVVIRLFSLQPFVIMR